MKPLKWAACVWLAGAAACVFPGSIVVRDGGDAQTDVARADADPVDTTTDSVDTNAVDRVRPPADGDDVSLDTTPIVDAFDTFAPVDVPTDDGTGGDIVLSDSPCAPGLTRCIGACIDTRSSLSNCGSCGSACPARPGSAAVCLGGVCTIVCNANLGDCDADRTNGCETSLTTPANCGLCRLACASGTPMCVPTSGTTYACAAGCTAGVVCTPGNPCATGSTVCMGGVTTCAPTGNRAVGSLCTGGVCNGAGNCVACTPGATCARTNVCEIGRIDCASGGPTCVFAGNQPPSTPCPTGTCDGVGSCVSTACVLPLVRCGTSCVDLTRDNNNCGSCGATCALGSMCADGTCSLPGLDGSMTLDAPTRDMGTGPG